MTGAKKLNRVSIDEYLAGEEISPGKHEYVGGAVYAMVGTRNAHNIIAGNAFATLWNRLRGQPCRPFNSDTKIRLRLSSETRFYYPDVSVVCRPNPQTEPFQDEPVVVIEVVSRRTRRIDEGEKRDAYLTIPSLHLYLLIEQDAPAVAAWRRTEAGFVLEEYKDLDAIVPMNEVHACLPAAELYDGVIFSPEPGE